MENMDKSDLHQMLCGEQWSNAACCGYLVLACNALGFNRMQTDRLLASVKSVFETYSVEAARETYMRY